MWTLDLEASIHQVDYPTLDDLWESPLDRELVLDLGCGDGRYLAELAERYRLAVGLDINEEAVACALAYEVFPPNVLLVQGDALQLPMRSESVSAVLASALLCRQTAANTMDLLEETARVLKPGGTLVLGICNPLRPIPESSPKFGAGPSVPVHEHVCACLQKYGLDWHIRSQSPACFWTIGAVKKYPVPKDSGTVLINRPMS